MTKKHLRTLEAIFAKPARANILWSDIESLFIHLGATIANKGGSVVTIKLGNHVATFHRPHPQKEAKKWSVERVRQFLEASGVRP